MEWVVARTRAETTLPLQSHSPSSPHCQSHHHQYHHHCHHSTHISQTQDKVIQSTPQVMTNSCSNMTRTHLPWLPKLINSSCLTTTPPPAPTPAPPASPTSSTSPRTRVWPRACWDSAILNKNQQLMKYSTLSILQRKCSELALQARGWKDHVVHAFKAENTEKFSNLQHQWSTCQIFCLSDKNRHNYFVHFVYSARTETAKNWKWGLHCVLMLVLVSSESSWDAGW